MIALPRQRGVAIALVLWLTSALMVMVAAMTWMTRTQAQLVSLQSQLVAAQALGEAAINLALRDMLAPIKAGLVANEGPEAPFIRHYQIADTDIEVRAIPVNGLININRAGEELLTALFIAGADLPADEARILAQRVIDWRDPDHIPHPLGTEDPDYIASGRPEGARDGAFLLPEDLLQVLNLNADVFARISRLITTLGEGDSVNPSLAPEEVLRVLNLHNLEVPQTEVSAQLEGGPTPAWGDGNLPPLDTSRSSIMRFESWIAHPDGTRSRYTRWVDIATPSPLGLPWLNIRTEPITHQKPPRQAKP